MEKSTTMTRRDYFAGLAMQGILAGEHSGVYSDTSLKDLAETAVRQADALIAELDKDKPKVADEKAPEEYYWAKPVGQEHRFYFKTYIEFAAYLATHDEWCENGKITLTPSEISEISGPVTGKVPEEKSGYDWGKAIAFTSKEE